MNANKKWKSWEEALDGCSWSEESIVDLRSNHNVWLCNVPAVWGEHRVLSFPDSKSFAIVNIDSGRMTAVCVGSGKASKLYVCGEHHWERLSTLQIGPGLDWLKRKTWDFRCREAELWEVAKTGHLPANRRVMGAIPFSPSRFANYDSQIEDN
jgi:hypothetical protein